MWNVAKTLVQNADKRQTGDLLTPRTHDGGLTTPRTHDGGAVDDDDKVKRKAVTGTPDKLASPSVVGEDRKAVVIDDEEVQKLIIKDQDLSRLRKSLQESRQQKEECEDATKSFLVRKVKTDPEKREPSMKQIVVARAAPPNAKLKQLEHLAPCGPRYSKTGEIIPHSILGSVQNFVEEAVKRRDMRANSPAVEAQHEVETLEVKKYIRPNFRKKEYIPTSMNQENALLNWRKKMADRKRQQGHISNLLSKPLERLVMNQAEMYREIQEKRNLVDRAIPAIDYGKGYRTGSEFWKQSDNFGDDLTGIKMTLTKTEKGSPVEFEHIGKPISVQHEMSESRQGRHQTVDHRRTWLSSKYLKQRTKQLGPIMKELDPYKPDISRLELIGTDAQSQPIKFDDENDYDESLFKAKLAEQMRNRDDPLSGFPDVIAPPFIGPSIVFNGCVVQWTGSSTDNEGKVGVVRRVTFESMAGDRTSSYLEVENNGTTAIYYEWRKVTQAPSFDSLVPDQTQRFYFNTGEGVILPGDTTKVPFVFKSPNPGIFTETWQFLTKPSVMGGAALQVILRGVAIRDDSLTESERSRIEKHLFEKEAQSMARQVIDDIVRGLQSPDRPPSPIDAYTTEEDIFTRKNPGRFYDHQTITQLKNIYLQLFPDNDVDGKEWDLSLDELQSCVSAVPDEEARDALLSGLNGIIGRLSFTPITPHQHAMYSIGYKLWQDTLDKLVGCSMLVRSVMGLPEVVMTEAVSEPDLSESAAPTQGQKPDPKGSSASSNNSQPSSVTSTPQPKPSADDKKGKGKKGAGKDAKEEKGKKGKQVKDLKEKDRPKSKDPKAKGGKGQAASPTKEQAERDDCKTPSSVRPTATPTTDSLDPTTRRKYTEKMYGQVYELLVEMIENMSLAFDDVKFD